jgi:hypothetical protein
MNPRLTLELPLRNILEPTRATLAVSCALSAIVRNRASGRVGIAVCLFRLRSHRATGVTRPFGRLLYGEPDAISNAVDYAKFYSRSHHAVICVYDAAGNAIETHEHSGDFKEW